jgi:phage baseplate assembly protein W
VSDFIGRGWTFPVRFDAGRGIRLAGGAEELDSAITMILSTAPGERVMRPDFGCAMWEQVFAPLNPNTLGLIEQQVREALSRWEPRIAVERVDALAEPDGSVVQINIGYRVVSTNDYRNLVHPFYVIPQEEPAP